MVNQNERIKVLHQSNKGVAEARNEGLRYILSMDENIDYVTFLDADDVWALEWIDDRIRKLMEQKMDLLGLQACICDHFLKRRAQEEKMNEGA